MASEQTGSKEGERSEPQRPVAIGPHVVSARQTAALREIVGSSAWSADFRERFFRKIRHDGNGCHIWLGAKKNRGYGFQVACLPFGRVPVLSHRIALALSIGLPAPGQTANHRNECRGRPTCVNPAHLYWGTQQENVADQVAARTFTGSKNSQSKLTERIVAEIRRLYRTGELTQRQLGARFGTSGVAIKYALCGQQWGHVPGAITPEEVNRIRHARRQREIERRRNANAQFSLDQQMLGRDFLGRSTQQIGELRVQALQSARAAVVRGETLENAVRAATQLTLSFGPTARALSQARAAIANDAPCARAVKRNAVELLDRAIEVAGGRKARRGGWSVFLTQRSNTP